MKSSKRTLRALFACAALLALLSCGGSDGGINLDPANLGPGPTQVGPSDVFPTGNVVGTVTSAADASPLASAAVASGANSTTSLSNGRWGLTLNTAARALASVSAGGYADNVRVFAVATLPVNVPAPLAPSGNATSITIANGGVAMQTGTPAQINLAANTLSPPAGVTASAAVDVRVTELNLVQNLNVLPGDYTALDGQGNPVPVEAFGALFITATDTSAARYALGTNQTATVRIPARTRGVALPNSLALFYLDESNGRWVQTANTAALNNNYYEGTITRLGFWAVAQAQPTVTLSGCVRDPADQPVANARVILEGVDYNASAVVLTAADGTFAMPLRTGGNATVTAQAGGAVSNTVAITSAQSAANFSLTPCLRTSGSAAGLSIKLTWGASPSDLDSHLFVPNGSHVFFAARGSLTVAPYASLDVDDVTGFGPEVVTIVRLYPGTYHYAVHNFSNTFNPGMTGSGARVELTRAGFTTAYAPPAGEGNNIWWILFDVIVDSQCRVTINNVPQWSSSTPAVTTTSAQPCN